MSTPIEEQWRDASRTTRLQLVWTHLPKFRNQRLFACACVRAFLWDQLNKNDKLLLREGEVYADKRKPGPAQKERDRNFAWHPAVNSHAVAMCSSTSHRMHAVHIAISVADLCGNPIDRLIQGRIIREMSPHQGLLWHEKYATMNVQELARTIYNTQDSGMLPIFADALEEAGANAPLVEAIRATAVFYRGNWIIDQAKISK